MDLGGAQQVALEGVARLDSERFDVELLAGPGGGLEAEARQRLGSRFKIAPLLHPISPLRDLWALVWLWLHFIRVRPDIVHTHSSKAGLIGRIAAFFAAVPCVVHTVHGWSFHDFQGRLLRFLYINLERLCGRLTQRFFVVAQSCRDKGLLLGIGRAGSYEVLRAAVDLKAWQSQRRERSSLNAALKHLGLASLKSGEKVVGCIANLKLQKNPFDFVRVASRVLKTQPRTRFVYVGDGPLMSEVKALAKQWGVAKQVAFLGWVQEPRFLAAGFDVFLLTSLWEGLPCVFPQALSMGLPVVATHVDGASELIVEGRNGYLAQPMDVESMAERVTRLLASSTLRAKISRSARSSVGPEFSYADMARRLSASYVVLAA